VELLELFLLQLTGDGRTGLSGRNAPLPVTQAFRQEVAPAVTPYPNMEGKTARESQLKPDHVSSGTVQVRTCLLLQLWSVLFTFILHCCLLLLSVDCKWKAWSDWSGCSEVCGGGNQSRIRDMSVEKYGGRPCKGSPVEIRDCNTHFCPGKGSVPCM